MKNPITQLCRCAVLVLLCAAATVVAHAQDYYTPEVSAVTGGSYSVSFVPNCGPLPAGYSCAVTYLMEQAGSGGAWSIVPAQGGIATFQNRLPGTYQYRVYAVAYDYYWNYIEAWSPVVSVVVSNTAVRESILEQLNYDYVVRQGDINADGRLDFLLSRTSGGQPLNGAVGDVILRQDSSRRFAAQVPTAAESSLASTWVLSPVEPVLEDFNADGFVDVALTGVDSVVAGADDQFVYAPGQIGSAATQGVRAFDDRMAQFVSDSMDYFQDQDYFSDYAPVHYYSELYWYGYCVPYHYPYSQVHALDYGLALYWEHPELWGYQVCQIEYYYQYGVYQDYSAFSNEALNLWIYDYQASQGLMDEDAALAATETEIEQLIGVDIGGWPMEEVLGPVGEHEDPFARSGIEIGRTVLGQARGGRNRTTSRLVPPQYPRRADQIYITGHPLTFSRSRGHLALEYTDSLGGGFPYTGETFSAEPENFTLINTGKLIAKTNRPTDHPLMNFVIGEVEPRNISDYLYWETFLRPRHNNYTDLPYAQKVDYAYVPLSWSGSYNSNSYVSGVTADSPANVDITVPAGIEWRYPGWGKPVPDYLFR